MTSFECLKGARVLITGHTGFKGAWLAHWLKSVGAKVTGYSLAPDCSFGPSLFEEACVGEGIDSHIADICDLQALEQVFQGAKPEFVFHLAAQALVRRSYRDPIATFATNVMGTANVLEAARRCGSVRALVCVTTDKCYRNEEWVWGYRENDPLGGKDPYSASKAAAEIVAHSYRQALLPLSEGCYALATARGGNVVGGGDWSEDRLVPDIVRAANAGKDLVLRNPEATRPWQHVLELVSGYMALAGALVEHPERACGAWNFGPDRSNEVTVEHLSRAFLSAYGATDSTVRVVRPGMAEANSLKLDISKALSYLPWKPRLDFDRTIALTADWYRGFHRERRSAAVLLDEQIAAYERQYL